MHWGALWVWLSVTLHRHGSHLVPAPLFIWEGCNRVASLFCRSLKLHIESLIEYAVWNWMRWMNPITYMGACIVPMLCELPQYIGLGLTGWSTWWLEVWLHMADLHTEQAFLISVDQYILLIAMVICLFVTVFSFLLPVYHFVIIKCYVDLFIHKYSERHLILNNNFFSPLQRWETDAIGPNV